MYDLCYNCNLSHAEIPNLTLCPLKKKSVFWKSVESKVSFPQAALKICLDFSRLSLLYLLGIMKDLFTRLLFLKSSPVGMFIDL